MTISNQTQQISYTAVGSTGEAFTIPFPFDDDDEIRLLEAGVLQTAGTVYTVTGAGTDDGGTATYASDLNPAAGAAIIITRILPLTQATNLLETGRFSAEALEAQLDRLVMTLQQMLGLNSTDGQTFDAGTKRIEDVVDPTGAQDAATMQFVQDQVSGAGNVPSPTSGQTGYHLEATAADTFGWLETQEVPTATAAGQVVVATGTSAGDNAMGTVPAAGGRAVNLLHNGSFQIAQNGTSFTGASVPINSNDTLLLDRWQLQSDGNDAVDVSQETTTVPDGALNSIKLLVTGTEDKKFGILQILEAEDTARVLNAASGKVSVSFEARTTTGAAIGNLRVGILGWTGTADSVTSDVVNAWSAAGTNPTLNSASWTTAGYLNVPANLALVVDTWTTFTETDIDIDNSGITNLAIFIWSDDTDTDENDVVYIGNVQLVIGDRVDTYGHRPIAEELALCQRYLQVFDCEGADDPFMLGYSLDNASLLGPIHLPVQMRDVPTLVVGSAATDFEVNGTGSTDTASGIAISQATKNTVMLDATTATNQTPGEAAMLQAVNGNAKLTFTAEL